MVTRALPDSELSGFADALAVYPSSFDKQALARANASTLPPDADVMAAYTEYSEPLDWPDFQAPAHGWPSLPTNMDPQAGASQIERVGGGVITQRLVAIKDNA